MALPREVFLPPEPKSNSSCFHSRDIQGYLDTLRTPKTATTRPEILHIPPCHSVHSFQLGRTAMRCDTRHVAQRLHTAIKIPATTRLSADTNPGRTSCAARAAPSVRSTTVPSVVTFGSRRASVGPRARRPAAAAVGTTTTAATAGTVATATATCCPRLALALSLLARGVRSGSDAGINATASRPTTGCPSALSSDPPRASGAYVRGHTGGYQTDTCRSFPTSGTRPPERRLLQWRRRRSG